jgi:hypothetical protein
MAKEIKEALKSLDSHFDNNALTNLNVGIDVLEIKKKYDRGEKLNEYEKLCVIPALDTEEEIKEIVQGNEVLEKLYDKYKKIKYNDATPYLRNLKQKTSKMYEDIINSEFVLKEDILYHRAYEIGFNNCLMDIIQHLIVLDYTKEEIEKIIDEKLEEIEDKDEKKED